MIKTRVTQSICPRALFEKSLARSGYTFIRTKKLFQYAPCDFRSRPQPVLCFVISQRFFHYNIKDNCAGSFFASRARRRSNHESQCIQRIRVPHVVTPTNYSNEKPRSFFSQKDHKFDGMRSWKKKRVNPVSYLTVFFIFFIDMRFYSCTNQLI